MFSCPKPPSKIKRSCHVHEFQINNRNVFTLSPKSKKENAKHILYLHGGAYVQSFVIFHWEFLAELVNKTGCTVTAPDYPLAPDHTYKESFSLASVLYHQLIAAGNDRHVILMGDSSGGGFALALAQKLKHEQVVQPYQIILLSPWLDITLSNPGIYEVSGFEPLLGIEGLRQAGKKYAGDASPDHYLLSPIYGPLEGLGKISVFIGTKDILVADTRKLKALAASKEIEINYQEYENMFHGWMFLNFRESKKAKEDIISLILH
nr:alpha/beta hydrolase [Longitalea luteola]